MPSSNIREVEKKEEVLNVSSFFSASLILEEGEGGLGTRLVGSNNSEKG